MKNLIVLFITILFLQFTLIAQEGWFQQSSVATDYLTSIYFTDSMTGWTVGREGIFYTTDGGDNWNIQSTEWCYDVFFVNKDTGWVVGGPTGLMKTTNGGMDWIDKPILNACLTDIFFADENVGWAIGPHDLICNPIIQKTTDGGETWIELQEADGQSLYFIDSNVGWYVDYGDEQGMTGEPSVIYKTTNGGLTFFPQDTAYTLFDICFTDYNYGWIVSRTDNILRTTNGGDTWEEVYPGGANSVNFINSNIGWVVGGSEILHTTNGGSDWTEQESGVNKSLWSVFFIDSIIGWAVGEDGTILHTINGGVSSVEEEEIDKLPTDFNLTQNYPNPFNPSTKIRYSVPQLSNVVIKVFDILGNEIETLVNEEKATGIYEITWYKEGLPSGVYFYQLRAGDFVETKKMVLMK
jgi:photosystem II stability/assembly factor-like uncharacterized protein